MLGLFFGGRPASVAGSSAMADSDVDDCSVTSSARRMRSSNRQPHHLPAPSNASHMSLAGRWLTHHNPLSAQEGAVGSGSNLSLPGGAMNNTNSINTKKSSMSAGRQLQCPLCHRLMQSATQPVLLQCGHTFCSDCAQQMPVFPSDQPVDQQQQSNDDAANVATSSMMADHDVAEQQSAAGSIVRRLVGSVVGGGSGPAAGMDTVTNTRSGHIFCLQCRGKTYLGVDGLAGLEQNAFLSAAADRLATQLDTCADCEKQQTSVHCVDCDLFLCGPCSSRIHSGAKTSRHLVTELRPSQDVGGMVDAPLSNRCGTHGTEECALYCSTCELLVCVQCAYGQHKQHAVLLVDEAVNMLKSQLHAQDEQVRQNAAQLAESARTVKKEVHALETNGASAKHMIKKRFAAIFAQLQRQQDQMLASVDDVVRDKDQALSQQWVNLTRYARDLKLRSQLCGRILESQHAPEVVEGVLLQRACLQTVLADIPAREPVVQALVSVSFRELSTVLRDLAESAADASSYEEGEISGDLPPADIILKEEPQAAWSGRKRPLSGDDQMQLDSNAGQRTNSGGSNKHDKSSGRSSKSRRAVMLMQRDDDTASSCVDITEDDEDTPCQRQQRRRNDPIDPQQAKENRRRRQKQVEL